jgi:ABC-type nitrate/sulfonate/bicarbonate transport system substrate-binding protein
MLSKKTAALAAALFACAFAAAPARAEMEKTSIAMPVISVTFAPTYVALDKGMWKARDLDVTLHDITGLGATNAMLAGSVDFAVASGPTLIRANIRGQKIIGLGLIANGLAFDVMMSKKAATEAGLSPEMPLAARAKALKGKKVSVDAPNTIVHAFLRYVAKKGGVNPEKDFVVSIMAPPAALAALTSGATQAATFTSPWQFISMSHGDFNLASGVTDVPELLPFASTATLTRPVVCEKKPTVCEKLMAGYLEAHKYVHDHPAETLAVLQKRMPRSNPAELKQAYERMARTTPMVPSFSEEGLAHAQELMVAGGMIKESEKLKSFDGIYTNKFLK